MLNEAEENYTPPKKLTTDFTLTSQKSFNLGNVSGIQDLKERIIEAGGVKRDVDVTAI